MFLIITEIYLLLFRTHVTCTYLGDDSRAACNFLTGQVDDTLSL